MITLEPYNRHKGRTRGKITVLPINYTEVVCMFDNWSSGPQAHCLNYIHTQMNPDNTPCILIQSLLPGFLLKLKCAREAPVETHARTIHRHLHRKLLQALSTNISSICQIYIQSRNISLRKTHHMKENSQEKSSEN
jgi:hypothetical protein